MVLYPRSGFGGKIFVLGSIRFNRESIDSRFLQNAVARETVKTIVKLFSVGKEEVSL